MSADQHAGRWKPGQTGNPNGRPQGQSHITKMRENIARYVPAIVERLVEAAQAGDVGAARLLLERVLPSLKATEQPNQITLPQGTLTEQGRAVLAAVAAGELATGQGSQLLNAMATLGKVAELDELAARVAALETRHAQA